MPGPNPQRAGAVGSFLGGVGCLGRGFGMWLTSPRLMLLGTIPALLVAVIYAALLVFFFANLAPIASWLTPFADGWDEPFGTIARILAGLALTAVVLLAVVYTYTATTLALGDPFYERIWASVEQRLGNAPDDLEEHWWQSAARSIGTAVRLIALAVLVSFTLFVAGFVPVIGQTLVPAIGVAFGGWFLTVELTGFAFDARGLNLRERRRMLATSRARTFGFGIATYLLFLIPLGAVVAMPAAVAGATLLSRQALEERVAAA